MQLLLHSSQIGECEQQLPEECYQSGVVGRGLSATAVERSRAGPAAGRWTLAFLQSKCLLLD